VSGLPLHPRACTKLQHHVDGQRRSALSGDPPPYRPVPSPASSDCFYCILIVVTTQTCRGSGRCSATPSRSSTGRAGAGRAPRASRQTQTLSTVHGPAALMLQQPTRSARAPAQLRMTRSSSTSPVRCSLPDNSAANYILRSCSSPAMLRRSHHTAEADQCLVLTLLTSVNGGSPLGHCPALFAILLCPSEVKTSCLFVANISLPGTSV